MKKDDASAYDADPTMMPIVERYHDKGTMILNYGGKFLRHCLETRDDVKNLEDLKLNRILKPIFDFIGKEKENFDDVMLEYKACRMMNNPEVVPSRAERDFLFKSMRDYFATIQEGMKENP